METLIREGGSRVGAALASAAHNDAPQSIHEVR
jgi:hypothetical protein